jgi:plasmid stabilization system protein ParE
MDLKEHLMASAERELGAYMSAVSELFGPEQAPRAADDWLDEFERMEALPETRRDFGAITIGAAVRLATWLNANGGTSCSSTSKL